MSRWLSSVNTLLEQLDGKVETAVEDQIHRDEDDDQQGVQNDVLEDILSKRGLVDEAELEGTESEEPKENETDDSADPDAIPEAVAEAEPSAEIEPSVENDKETPGEQDDQLETNLTVQPVETTAEVSDEVHEGKEKDIEHDEAEVENSEINLDELETSEQEPSASVLVDQPEPTQPPTSASVDQAKPTKQPESVAEDQPEPTQPPPPAVPPAPSRGKDTETLVAELREAQKEARTLRRHVISLNTHLEAAEAEISAQRTELERAAERMEKDRTRYKDEKEKLVARHGEEIKSIRQQHDLVIADQKKRSDEQLEEARKRMMELEERRMQEGGDWTKELEEAIKREQATVQRQVALEDEKSTLLSQLSTLQSQQAALESRLESVTQTAETAMNRERESEDRLDSALSLHARQLSQRQAREVELERTIAELGAALVVARNREINRLKGTQASGEITGGSEEHTSLRTKLEASEDELETVKAQLELERQRCQTLHQELRDMSQERTEETSAAHARQRNHDRELADMTATISRLQTKLRDSTKEACRDQSNLSADDAFSKDDVRMKTLTEQVLKQQEKIGNYTSEISALRNRLQAALRRADSAEQALTASGNSADAWDALERGMTSEDMPDDSWRRTMRRRGANRGGRAESYGGSIRSAIRLAPGQTERKEKIGRAIDHIDQWSVETGKFLRFNPLARGAFLLYLLILHIWTFVLLMFHTHNFENVHGDFGAGGHAPHGPHALMRNESPSLPHP